MNKGTPSKLSPTSRRPMIFKSSPETALSGGDDSVSGKSGQSEPKLVGHTFAAAPESNSTKSLLLISGAIKCSFSKVSQ